MQNESDLEEHYDFDEDEMDALLDQVESETLGSEEDAIAFFEKKYKEITEARRKLNKKRPRKIDNRSVHEHFLDDSAETIESEFKGKWFL